MPRRRPGDCFLWNACYLYNMHEWQRPQKWRIPTALRPPPAKLVRRFAHYSDLALSRPIVVTRNGRPRNVLLSVAEYERLEQRDQQAFTAKDTPEHFLREIEKLAAGDA